MSVTRRTFTPSRRPRLTSRGWDRRPGRDLIHIAAFVAVLSITLAVLAPPFPADAQMDGFSDVDEAGVHTPSIQALGAGGIDILAGTDCADGRFCPDDELSRWTMAVWLVRVLDGGDPDPSGVSRFTDVGADGWWAPFTDRLADLGVTAGCRADPPGYCPHRPVTRGQMASFLSRAFDLPDGPSASFSDVAGTTHASAISRLAAAGITVGAGQGRYYPDRPVTRGQAATFLARAMHLVPPADFTRSTGDNLLFYIHRDVTVEAGFNRPGRIWTTTPGGIRRLVTSQFSLEDVQASPDGKWVAYNGFPSNYGELLNIDTGETRSIGSWDPEYQAKWGFFQDTRDHLWSPDSSYLVYEQQDSIWIESVEGKNRRMVSTTRNSRDIYFSSDSRYVMNSRNTTWVDERSLYQFDIFDIPTGDITTFEGRQPHLGPESSRVAYFIVTEPEVMWIMNADGTNRQRFPHLIGRLGEWSPDGSLLAFRPKDHRNWVVATRDGEIISSIPRSSACEAVRWDGNSRLILHYPRYLEYLDVGDHQSQVIEDIPARVVWSDDHSRIAYISGDDSFRGSLWVIDSDGANRRKLVDLADLSDSFTMTSGTLNWPWNWLKNIRWSTDNQYIAFVLSRQTEEPATFNENKITVPPDTKKAYDSLWIVDTQSGAYWRVIEKERIYGPRWAAVEIHEWTMR